MGEARKIEVGQFPDGIIQTNKPAMFIIHKNGAKGQLDAKVVSPNGVADDCFIDTADFETYSVRFMPRENGINSVHIKFNQVHIPGSPFRVKVGDDQADPAAITVAGKGLQDVVTGQKTDFIIDTCNAGAGHLVVTIDGQSKVAMDCTEVEEGYKVRYTPLVPGDYFIAIKYNGFHVVGSPFKVTCTGKEVGEKGAQETSTVVVETVQKISKHSISGPTIPLFKSDASKITCKGMGLKKAFLARQNQFTICATDAGTNMLFVGMMGPKGPVNEIYVKHMGRNNYNISYVCTEKGEYILLCKWGEQHIPGSPFRIEC
jgi:filamin